MKFSRDFMDLQNSNGSGKTIDYYRSSSDTFVWVNDKVPLVDEVSSVRQSVAGRVVQVDNSIKSGMNYWFSVEKKVTKYIDKVSVPQEKAFPALVYVGIGAIGGSIFARMSLSLSLIVLLYVCMYM
jgi:hypothetical protein